MSITKLPESPGMSKSSSKMQLPLTRMVMSSPDVEASQVTVTSSLARDGLLVGSAPMVKGGGSFTTLPRASSSSSRSSITLNSVSAALVP